MSAAAQLKPLSALAQDSVPRDTTNPEFDLLVACCTATWAPSESRRVGKLLAAPINWETLLALAQHHGLFPVLFQSVETFSSLIPPNHYGKLRLACQQNACRALWFAQELGRVLDGMMTVGIEVLAHKGPALASLLYGDVAQRQFHDLDILVSARDVNRATTVLSGLGYHPDIEFNLAEQQAHLRSGYEQVFHSPNGTNLLELQWQLLPRFYAIDFEVEELFARARAVNVADRACRTLSSEDLLLALCVHAAKHGWTQLSWLRDINQLARKPGLAWHFIGSEARRLGILRILAVNRILCDRLFGAESMWSAISPKAPTSGTTVDAIVDEILIRLRDGIKSDIESPAYFLWTMGLREKYRDQVRFLWRLASTPSISEWKSVKLPAPLFPLYRVVRVSRLVRKFAGAT